MADLDLLRRGEHPAGVPCEKGAPLWALFASATAWTVELALAVARADGAGPRVGAVAWVERALGTCVLGGADLRGAGLGGACLSGADLAGACLHGANLAGADLVGADLRGVDFRGADLRGVDFRGADFHDVDFRGADLRGVDFRGADFHDVDFRDANLAGAYGDLGPAPY